MEYKAIHEALKAEGLTWHTAADAIGCAPSNLMAVAKGDRKSRPVALRLSLLIRRDISEVFPDIASYSTDPELSRSQIVEAARKRLEEAGAPALNVKSA